jgi:hypothetical protein
MAYEHLVSSKGGKLFDDHVTVHRILSKVVNQLPRGVHRVLVGKPEGKRPLRRPRRRWDNNIEMGLQEVGGGRGDWRLDGVDSG